MTILQANHVLAASAPATTAGRDRPVSAAGAGAVDLDTSTCRFLKFRGVNDAGVGSFDYELPDHLEAGEPPESRGLRRDQVKLMVSHYGDPDALIEHTQFEQIGQFLDAGDVLVINVSGTLNAALEGKLAGAAVHMHLSTKLAEGRWVVEIRQPTPQGTKPRSAESGQVVALDAGGSARLKEPYQTQEPGRLWVADIDVGGPVEDYLVLHGAPIRYGYVQISWPSQFYQTVYATEPGSAEMPSAGRAFSTELITQLVARGIRIAPLVLHTGVASLEDHEPPYAEWYRVPETSAQLIRQARVDGRRVIAVGTTAVRALESVTDAEGNTRAGEGWTDLIIRPEGPLRAVDGLLTGLHEPRATHLAMLLALAGPDHVCTSYSEALEQNYLWHEFGDLHLLLP